MISVRHPLRGLAATLVTWLAVNWPVQATELYSLGQADTMSKVFRDEPGELAPVETLCIEAARNEVEGIQLIVSA